MAANPIIRITLLASGNGSNAENIIRYFAGHGHIRVNGVLCNRPGAGVIQRAASLGLPCRLFTRDEMYHSPDLLNELKNETDWLVLAGFLWLVPADWIAAFSGKVVNLHPALLPSFGGKGMYGHHVHEAVLASGATRSGITIHFVNGHYDEGNLIAQFECALQPGDTPETLAGRIHELEYEHFPAVIEKTVLSYPAI